MVIYSILCNSSHKDIGIEIWHIVGNNCLSKLFIIQCDVSQKFLL